MGLGGSDLFFADVDAYGTPRRPDRESDLPEARTGTAAQLDNPLPRLGVEGIEHRDSPNDEVVAPSHLLLNRSELAREVQTQATFGPVVSGITILASASVDPPRVDRERAMHRPVYELLPLHGRLPKGIARCYA